MLHLHKFAKGLAIATFIGVVSLPQLGCKPKTPVVKLQREWTANSEFAGDVWAEDISPKYNINLVVSEGSELNDPVKIVRSGTAQFGVASADRILRENEGGADLVILAASTYKSPVVFLSHPQDHISSPSDFRNRTIGIQSGTNTELVFKSLMASQKLTSAPMKVVESGWGTTNFETGALNVLAAFDYDEPVQLQRRNIQFQVLRPEDYGVHYVGTVYFTTRKLIQQNPALVHNFMRALVEGWKLSLADPSAAIKRVSNHFDKFDTAKELQSLQRGESYFSGEQGHLLYASPARWNEMAANLEALGLIRSFKFEDNVDYEFLDSAIHGDAK